MASATSPALTELDAAALQEMAGTSDDLVIMDVRSAAEFESLHIRGSYNVPLPLLSEHTGRLAERLGGRVVLVCQSGARAEQARGHLSGAGIESALVLKGGVPAFAAAGGDVVRGVQRWSLERQVRMATGSLVIISLAGARFISPKLCFLAGGVGAGLAFSAATNTCAMGRALSKLPWNKGAAEPTASSAIAQLPAVR